MEMFQCQACNHIGEDFEEVTEASILEFLSDPDEIEQAMSEVGALICPACGSSDCVML